MADASHWAADLASGSFGAVLCAMVGLPVSVSAVCALYAQNGARVSPSCCFIFVILSHSISLFLSPHCRQFDTTKTRMQTNPALYSGMKDAFSRIVRQEGALALWKGGSPAVASAVVENSVLFTVNGMLKRAWADTTAKTEGDITPMENAVIGGLSGFFSATAICPPEVVKCRLQVQRAGAGGRGGAGRATAAAPPRYSGAVDCVKKTHRADGLRGFFRGWTPLLMRDVPFNLVLFGCENLYMRSLAHVPWLDPSGPAVAFLSGGLAGSTAWALLFPFDLIKSRMQVSTGDGRTTVASMACALHATGGVAVFYRGVVPAVTRAFFANGALFFGKFLVGFMVYDR